MATALKLAVLHHYQAVHITTHLLHCTPTRCVAQALANTPHCDELNASNQVCAIAHLWRCARTCRHTACCCSSGECSCSCPAPPGHLRSMRIASAAGTDDLAAAAVIKCCATLAYTEGESACSERSGGDSACVGGNSGNSQQACRMGTQWVA